METIIAKIEGIIIECETQTSLNKQATEECLSAIKNYQDILIDVKDRIVLMDSYLSTSEELKTSVEEGLSNINLALELVNTAVNDANNAATLANNMTSKVNEAISKVDVAIEKMQDIITIAEQTITSVNTATASANASANNANTQADYAKVQGDYAKAQGDAVKKIIDDKVTTEKLADGAVTTEKLADGAVTTEKLNNNFHNFLKEEIGSQLQELESGINTKLTDLESDFNLLPVEKIILQDGKHLIYNGKEVSNSAFGISDYISVAEGMVVSCANTVHNDVSVIGLYDDNKVMETYISLSAADDEVVFIIPAKIRFLRASYLVASKDKFYIHTDFPSSTGYIGDKIDKLIELPISLNMDGYIDSKGTFIKNSDWKSSDFVDINWGYTLECTYYLTSTTFVCIYDKDKRMIASFPGTEGVKKTTITINPNVYPTLKYLRVCSYTGKQQVDYSTKISSIFGMIPNDSVTTPKIAEKAVTPAKLSFFIHDLNTNFIKQDNWVANKLINAQGQESSQSGFWATGFIPLLPNTVYYNNALWYGYYAFYDADKNLIKGHDNDGSLTNPFTTPAGTAYGRFTCINTDNKNKAWIGLVNNPAPYAEIIDPQYVPAMQEKTYCDYEGNEFSMFNKCICVGDSLTEGVFNENGSGIERYVGFKKYSYPTFLSKLTGVEVSNLGNAGDTSAEWYDRHKGDDLSGYDVAIIQLGTNDAARYSGWTETSITGFTNIINKLKNENTNIKIFVSTISKRFGDPGAAGKAVISDGIRQLVLSLADPNVILLDMEEYAHTGDEQAYECGHYSAYGYWRLAQDYKNIIGYYINSHKNLFRTVQFIGTDYSYS